MLTPDPTLCAAPQPEDADRALGERQHLRPACDWTVKQNPEEWYVLEGQQRGRNVVLQATQ